MTELREFARLVRNLRNMQQRYFRSREQTDLRICKDLERRVDEKVAEILAEPPAPQLFE
jgi:hypothetical protein